MTQQIFLNIDAGMVDGRESELRSCPVDHAGIDVKKDLLRHIRTLLI